MVITGTAYNRSATLEVAGDTLTWRATQGWTGVHENIVTTIHQVRFARLLELRHTWGGVAVAGLGVLLWLREGIVVGVAALAIAAALIAWRYAYPRRYLVLGLGQTQLVLRVAPVSAVPARVLVDRIDQAILSGEMPSSPPMLP